MPTRSAERARWGRAAALFFPEKRPFFLDGSELFQVPLSLIYTRRIVQPVLALKLTGQVAGSDIGILSAVAQKFASHCGTEKPLIKGSGARATPGPGSRTGVA